MSYSRPAQQCQLINHNIYFLHFNDLEPRAAQRLLTNGVLMDRLTSGEPNFEI